MPKEISSEYASFMADVEKARLVIVECLELNNIHGVTGLTAMQSLCSMLAGVMLDNRDKFVEYLNDKHRADLEMYDNLHGNHDLLSMIRKCCK